MTRILYVDSDTDMLDTMGNYLRWYGLYVDVSNDSKQAISIAEVLTRLELKKDDAFENLDFFVNDFSRMRNYEIENYLSSICQYNLIYGIAERCPFNGYGFFE